MEELKKTAPKIEGIKIEKVPRKRGIRISVLPNSTVVVRCGSGLGVREVDRFVFQHKDWLVGSLQKSKDIQSQFPLKLFSEGETFPLLGRNYTLEFQPSVNIKSGVRLSGDSLVFEIPKAHWTENFKVYPHPNYKKDLLDFYFRTAQRIIMARTNILIEQTGLRPGRITLRKQKTIWGSCSANKNIQLNWKLIAAPLNIIDYVIVHELIHLRHPNHSKNFWSEVKNHCPEYRQARSWLRKNYYSFDFLNEVSEIHASFLGN